MKNLICAIFKHKIIVRDWYPDDPITTHQCMRCDEIIRQFPNPRYGQVWYRVDSSIPAEPTIPKNQIISDIDPYGEEIWD